MIRVLLVDDQAMVRVGFRMIIETEADLTVVGEAADGHEAIELVERCRPDIVLMDVRMPRTDVLEVTAVITARPDAPRVLMLTTFDAQDYVDTALRAGASGFLLKDAPAEQLIEAIRVIERGDARRGGVRVGPGHARRSSFRLTTINPAAETPTRTPGVERSA